MKLAVVWLVLLCGMAAQAATIDLAYAKYFDGTDEICLLLSIKWATIGDSGFDIDGIVIPEINENPPVRLGVGLSMIPFDNNLGLKVGIGYVPGGAGHATPWMLYGALPIISITW